MHLPTARQLMVPLDAYPHVRAECSLREALQTFGGARIEMHGEVSLPRILLVFDGEETLVGMVRRRDILRGLSPRWFFTANVDHPEALYEVDVDQNIGEVLRDKVVSRFRDRSQRPITDYVQSIRSVAAGSDSLIRLVNVMVEKGHHMLPVIDDGEVIGVVRSVEVMWAVEQLIDGGDGFRRG